MASLLDKINGRDTAPDIESEVPDEFPQEWAEEYVQDPAPGPAKAAPKKLLTVKTTGQITPAMKRRIAAELEAYVQMMAIPVIMRDEVCGGVIHDQAKDIADSIATILSRYPDLAHKFLATGVLGDWVKLLIAIKPIVTVVYSHHISKKTEEEDHDTPDYSTYPAFRPGA
jgi:hypothetical protein